ncbi:hypothetical protein A9G11_12875 [Gilliamella sp. wkB108]|uniref:hypothetical protein n=1 Tax=Gilliamella sp. wkB108 TaxID=3120256 RepID=UPI00080D9E55|nr:hypothetical protein [Gilliamella apicola]OCG27302.1 hypothetical protein A9G11_12875 [Gilliamella apicola]
MKRLSYIGILWIILASYTYGQLVNINEEYRGDPFISKINMQQLERNCKRDANYEQMSATDREKDDNRCPLRHLTFNFRTLTDSIITISDSIYLSNYLTIQLRKEFYENTKDRNYQGCGLSLAMINDDRNQSQINLTYWYENQTTSQITDYQYHYIAPSGDIYTLLSKETDTGITPLLWKHYKIDTEKMKFILKEMIINDEVTKTHYQIIYPTQFNVLSSGKLAIDSKQALRDLCLAENDDKYDKCYFTAYNYYLNELKQKITSLDAKKKSKINTFPKLKQDVDAICLMTQTPSYPNDINPYLADITGCFIQYFKDEIKQTEEELAK